MYKKRNVKFTRYFHNENLKDIEYIKISLYWELFFYQCDSKTNINLIISLNKSISKPYNNNLQYLIV